MKKHSIWIALTLALMLAGSVVAVPAKTKAPSPVSKISGTIVSSSSSSLVLSSKVKGKMEQETFLLNPQTKTEGALAKGERAVVRFKDENGQKVATNIHAYKAVTHKAK
jgi:hypothetical protein